MMLLDDFGTPTRLIRSYLHTNEAEEAPIDPSEESRFLGPYQFDEEQRKLLDELFDRHDLGDEEGRRIFLLAVEYEIATLEEVTEAPSPDPTVSDEQPLVTQIAESARALATLLNQLPPTAMEQIGKQLTELDPFRRLYGTRYFDALGEEILRLGALSPPTPEAPPSPLLSDKSSMKFLSMFADAYYDCFELLPSMDASGPFMELLDMITQEAALPIRKDGPLIQASIDSIEP
ncbi:MAG TPA: hypothetical protein EYH03_06210 [Chromatiales bacterium]|nr:hypothetical protein [Chromatiales bacterium]